MKAKKGSRRGACSADRVIKPDSELTVPSKAGRSLRQTQHEAVKQVIIAQPVLRVMMRCGGAIRQ